VRKPLVIDVVHVDEVGEPLHVACVECGHHRAHDVESLDGVDFAVDSRSTDQGTTVHRVLTRGNRDGRQFLHVEAFTT
jgi:Zn ribbon nucleic-acid-binding protein